MKQLYSKIAHISIVSIGALLMSLSAFSQVEKPFTQRTSHYTPNKKIYSLKGDFTLLGNTNLSPQNYTDSVQNGNTIMQYVDADNSNLIGLNGIPTFNSSSATLSLSNENGAQPNCSNIVFAGLYWSGRSARTEESPMQFSVTKEVQTGVNTFDNNYVVGHNQPITGTNYAVTVGRQGAANNYFPRYTVYGGGALYQFSFNNNVNNRVSVSVNGQPAIYLPATVEVIGNKSFATLINPYLISSNGAMIAIKKLERLNGNNIDALGTINNGFIHLNVSGSTPIIQTYTKNFDKRKIQLMGPGASSYTEFTANNNDIFFPTTTNDYMYSAFVEVTDYVRNHGVGKYSAADMALIEGDGGGTGYFGGWSMIVIYENSLMNNRDITLFDGYAYVAGNATADFELPISGFNTIQTGPVGMKIGLISGEGDLDISGDYFQIKKQSDGTFQSLENGPNSQNNFFGSRISNSIIRTPNLANNTGVDIAMIQVNNPNNSVIGNNQTETTFKYGSTQDTYIIYAMAMAVDAYNPEIEGQLSNVSINGDPVNANSNVTVVPGDSMEFSVHIRNLGSEPLTGAHISIPIPFNTEYVANSANGTFFISPIPSPNQITYDPNLGANGTLIWNIGDLPLPQNPNDILATLTFSLVATQDCNVLQSACSSSIQLNGNIGALGSYTGINSGELPFVLGRETSADCLNTTIPAPLDMQLMTIDFIQQHCQGVPTPVAFNYCELRPIEITEVIGSFPLGTTFYNTYPVTADSHQYNINNPFPAQIGTTTYYAIPPQPGNGCFYTFTITIQPITTIPVVGNHPEYCINQTALPLTATTSTNGLNLYYFTAVDGQPQSSIIPNTSVAGTFTYYVAEGSSPNCYGEKVPITVTVNANGNITAPANLELNSCSENQEIGGLPISLQTNQITAQQFLNIGGSLSEISGPIAYIDTISGNCPIQITRTFSAVGSCGPVSAIQTFVIHDTTAPTFTQQLPSLTIGCGENPEFTTPIVTDNCNPNITLNHSDTEVVSSCGNTIWTRTWTATDVCGNSSQISQTITREDVESPIISQSAQNLTLTCEENIEGQIQQWLSQNGLAMATDACSEIIWNHNYTPTTLACNQPIQVIFTATDACGNSTETSAQIQIIDTTAPIFTGVLEDINLGCADEIPTAQNLIAIDGCSGEITGVLSENQTVGNCPNSIVITRTWTFTNACQNSSSVTQTIRKQDQDAPIFELAPIEFTATCLEDFEFPTPVVHDACGSEIQLTFNDSETIGNCPTLRTIVRTWTATDVCGNASELTQMLHITNVLPTISQQAQDISFECGQDNLLSEWLENHGNAQLTPGCSELSWTHNYQPQNLSCDVPVTVVFTATDGCGNSIETSAQIHLIDITAPVISQMPQNITVNCSGEVPTAMPLTATDNCMGEISVMPIDHLSEMPCANQFTITRIWNFVDGCGNQSSATQIITVSDTTLPTLPEIPTAISLTCPSELPEAPVLTVVDECSGEVITAISSDEVIEGSCPMSKEIIRTFTFTDVCKNQATIVQHFTINDNIAPTFITEIPVNITSFCSVTIPEAPQIWAVDNCSDAAFMATMNEEITPGVCSNSYTITRTWTATDLCGNAATASQTIQVSDNEAPVFDITVEEEITVNCGEIPAVPAITAFDACSNTNVEVLFHESEEAANCPNTAMIIRTWTAIDACGNETHQTQLIHVIDQTAPVLQTSIPAQLFANCDEIPAVPELEFTDSCSSEILVDYNESTSTPENGQYTITRTWSATDSCLNLTSFIQEVIVNTGVAPLNSSAYAACNIDNSLILDLTAGLPSGIPTTGTFSDPANTGALQGSSFVPYNLETGNYIIDYVYSTDVCRESVRITVEVDDDCEVQNECEPVIHNAFSPNGDGKNDVFVISSFEDIHCIINNRVEIYNRWGILVFEMDNYNNTTRAFRGISEGRATINKSEELPAGTYFYLIQYTKADGSAHKKDGYLYLSR